MCQHDCCVWEIDGVSARLLWVRDRRCVSTTVVGRGMTVCQHDCCVWEIDGVSARLLWVGV